MPSAYPVQSLGKGLIATSALMVMRGIHLASQGSIQKPGAGRHARTARYSQTAGMAGKGSHGLRTKLSHDATISGREPAREPEVSAILTKCKLT